MRLKVRTFRAPGWIVPALALIALALLPFALMLALGLATLAAGAAAVRALLPGADRSLPPNGTPGPAAPERGDPEPPVIDVDYEVVKDEHEKK